MWVTRESDKYVSNVRRFARRYKAATLAALDNLDTYLKDLRDGRKPSQIRARFIHPEFSGIVAIDQTGTRRKLTETRLYVYPDEDTETLYLITIGKKDQQQRRDLPDCRSFWKELRRTKSNG